MGGLGVGVAWVDAGELGAGDEPLCDFERMISFSGISSGRESCRQDKESDNKIKSVD